MIYIWTLKLSSHLVIYTWYTMESSELRLFLNCTKACHRGILPLCEHGYLQIPIGNVWQ